MIYIYAAVYPSFHCLCMCMGGPCPKLVVSKTRNCRNQQKQETTQPLRTASCWIPRGLSIGEQLRLRCLSSWRNYIKPMGSYAKHSMYGILANINLQNDSNAGKYSIHWVSGYWNVHLYDLSTTKSLQRYPFVLPVVLILSGPSMYVAGFPFSVQRPSSSLWGATAAVTVATCVDFPSP